MMVAYSFSDKDSLYVIRRALMHLASNPESFPTRSDLVAKPTPDLRLSSLLRPLKKKVKTAPTSL